MKLGDLIFFQDIKKKYVVDAPENISLNILYEEESFLVINKPKSLVVHPGSGNVSGTLLNALLWHYKKNKFIPRSGIVHRLDKNTTGLMVIAKNIVSYNYFINLFKNRKIYKEYLAIVLGRTEKEFCIDKPIKRHHFNRIKMMTHKLGKPSFTFCKVIRYLKNFTYLKVIIKSGRTHQIRVHLSDILYPILGDNLYGGDLNSRKNFFFIKNFSTFVLEKLLNFNRPALHAYQLKFIHPITNTLVNFKAPLPDDFKNIITLFKEKNI